MMQLNAADSLNPQNRPTLLNVADGTTGDYLLYDFDHDGLSDLVFIKRRTTGTGTIEVHVLTARTGYRNFVVQTGTALSQLEEANGDFFIGDYDRDGVPDLYFIKRRNTGTGRIEVHILSGNSNWKQFILQTGTPLSQGEDSNGDFMLGDCDGDGIPDLYFIKRRNTGTNSIEVHVLSGASNYQSFIVQSGTPLAATESPNGDFLLNTSQLSGPPDLYYVKRRNTASQQMEVRVLSGRSYYQQLSQNTITGLSQTEDGNGSLQIGDCNGDGVAELLYFKRRNTASGAVEFSAWPSDRARLPSNRLAYNTYMKEGQYLSSINGLFFATIEQGRLAVYKGAGPFDAAKQGMWSCSGPVVSNGHAYLAVQPDGNMCIYEQGTSGQGASYSQPYVADNSRERGDICRWNGAIPAVKGSQPCYLTMQIDGNLCVYWGTHPENPALDTFKWSLPAEVLPGFIPRFGHVPANTNFLAKNQFIWDGEYITSANRQFHLLLENGVLAIYAGASPSNPRGRPLWNSNNAAVASVRHCLIMQNDGNLCIYTAVNQNLNTLSTNTCVWNTGTVRGPSCAVLRDDGHLEVVTGAAPNGGVLTWTSNPPPASSGASSGGGSNWYDGIIKAIPSIVSGGII